MSTGTVSTFDAKKGYGFISDDSDPEGKQLFVHFRDLQMDGFRIVYSGDAVAFDRQETPKGARAVNVRTL